MIPYHSPTSVPSLHRLAVAAALASALAAAAVASRPAPAAGREGPTAQAAFFSLRGDNLGHGEGRGRNAFRRRYVAEFTRAAPPADFRPLRASRRRARRDRRRRAFERPWNRSPRSVCRIELGYFANVLVPLDTGLAEFERRDRRLGREELSRRPFNLRIPVTVRGRTSSHPAILSVRRPFHTTTGKFRFDAPGSTVSGVLFVRLPRSGGRSWVAGVAVEGAFFHDPVTGLPEPNDPSYPHAERTRRTGCSRFAAEKFSPPSPGEGFVVRALKGVQLIL